MGVKIIVCAKKIVVGIPSTCICENSKYLKSTSLTECHEIIIVMNNVSTKKTIATNATRTASVNHYSIKVRDFHIRNHITVDNYYYLLWLCKTKKYNIKWKIMN